MEAIIVAVIAGVTWLVTVTTFFVGLKMKTDALEKNHKDCKERREYQETVLLSDVSEVRDTLIELKNDMKWVKNTMENGMKKDGDE